MAKRQPTPRRTRSAPSKTASSIKKATATSSAPLTKTVGSKAAQALIPALERSIDSFSEELRKEFDAVHDALATANQTIADLRADVDALRAQYEGHTHRYSRTITGSGAQVWFDLKKMKKYMDEDLPGQASYHGHGVYLRSAPVGQGEAPSFETEPPTAG